MIATPQKELWKTAVAILPCQRLKYPRSEKHWSLLNYFASDSVAALQKNYIKKKHGYPVSPTSSTGSPNSRALPTKMASLLIPCVQTTWLKSLPITDICVENLAAQNKAICQLQAHLEDYKYFFFFLGNSPSSFLTLSPEKRDSGYIFFLKCFSRTLFITSTSSSFLTLPARSIKPIKQGKRKINYYQQLNIYIHLIIGARKQFCRDTLKKPEESSIAHHHLLSAEASHNPFPAVLPVCTFHPNGTDPAR